MALPKIKFSHPGKPCDSSRIRQMERKLNRKLPKDYAEFIKGTGGGMLSPLNCYFDNIPLPSGKLLDCRVDQLFGNGRNSLNEENDIADETALLTEKWKLPPKVLLIGLAVSGLYECIVMNFDLNEFPRHSVLYLDSETDDGFILVAHSFTEFLKILRPSPGYREFTPSPLDGKQGIHAARKAPLGEKLQNLIRISPIPNMEQILRNAAEQLAADDLIQVYVTEGSFKFQDLIFYLAQNAKDYPNLYTWMSSGSDGSRPEIYKILSESFLTTHEWSAVQYFDASITGWHESRTELGVLKETPNGLKLDEDYVRKVASQFE